MVPSVTVVIPTHNRITYLQEAVASVREQPVDWELVVVVDASTDGTSEWLAKLDDPRVSALIMAEHSERATARNSGLKVAKGGYILFLDDDDRLGPQALSKLASALDRYDHAVAAVGSTINFDDNGQRRRMTSHPRRERVLDVSADAMIGWAVTIGSTLFRTDIVRGVGGFQPGLEPVEDQYLWLQLSQRGPAVTIAEPVVFVRFHAGQRRSEAKFAKEDSFRTSFMSTLSGEALQSATKAFEARLHRRKGIDAWRRNDIPEARRCFVAEARAAPRLLVSPIHGRSTRRLLLRTFLGTFIPPRLAAMIQRTVWRLRTRLGRAPGGAEPLLPYSRED